MRETRRLVFASEKCQSSIGVVTYNGNQLVQHGIEWWRADPMNNDGKGRGTRRRANSDEVGGVRPYQRSWHFLIDGDSTPPGKHSSFLSFLNSLRLPLLSSFQLLLSTSKMASIARSIRPFASQALAQKSLVPACRAAPAFRFPRGSRSFSQSPLGELLCPPSWQNESPGPF